MATTTLNPPATAITRSMTVDEFWDFCQLPENQERNLELIRGEVVEMSRPLPPHGIASANIGFELMLWGRRNRVVGYIATGDSGVILRRDPDTLVGPDAAYFSAAKAPTHWGDVAPVLAVEVLSPNDRPGRVNAKVRQYLDAGTRVVWLIDSDDRTVAVYRPGRDFQILKRDEILSGEPELPEFQCVVSHLFLQPGEFPA